MPGDATTRICGACTHPVHNLSAMTAPEAEAFLAQQLRPGMKPACVAFYRREDGTILTQDCPVGVAAWRRRIATKMLRMAVAMALLISGAIVLSAKQRAGVAQRLRASQPFRTVCEWVSPSPVVPPAPPPLANFRSVPLLGGIPILGQFFQRKANHFVTRADGSPYTQIPDAAEPIDTDANVPRDPTIIPQEPL